MVLRKIAEAAGRESRDIRARPVASGLRLKELGSLNNLVEAVVVGG